jgi:hypothetical protein
MGLKVVSKLGMSLMFYGAAGFDTTMNAARGTTGILEGERKTTSSPQ